jgi:hypothetical protein
LANFDLATQSISDIKRILYDEGNDVKGLFLFPGPDKSGNYSAGCERKLREYVGLDC